MKMKRLIPIIIVLTVGLFIISSCSKNTDPKRFDKIIATGSWRISKATINSVVESEKYRNRIFRFYSSNTFAVTLNEKDTISGVWSRGIAKDPLRFYMDFPPLDSLNASIYAPLDQEWFVSYLTKAEIRLEKGNSQDTQIILRNRE